MFKTIIVGVDESDRSRYAAKVAADIAQKYGADLVLVHAYEPVPRYLGNEMFENAVEKALTYGEKILEETVKILPEGIVAETDLLEGPAANALLSAAEAHKADLIVIGSRGLGELAALALGSVGHKLIQQSPVPVLIVKHGNTEA